MLKKKNANVKLMAARTAKGVSQKDLARRLRIQPRDVIRMEQGWVPPVDVQKTIAVMLGIPVRELFGA